MTRTSEKDTLLSGITQPVVRTLRAMRIANLSELLSSNLRTARVHLVPA
jgi:hypothetical protein